MKEHDMNNQSMLVDAAHISLVRQSGQVVGHSLVDALNAPSISARPWRLSTHGYAVRSETLNGKKRTVYLHREILGVEAGALVDHINGDRLDNRMANLRLATHSENNANSVDRPRRSGYRGVYWHGQASKWVAQISVGGGLNHLGLFRDPQEAARTYDRAAMAIHGRFARTNFHSGSDDSGDYKAGYEVGYDAGIQIGLETGPDVDFIAAFSAGYETGVLAKPGCDAGSELVLGNADRPGGSYSAFGHGFEIGHIGADREDDVESTFNLGYAEGYRAGVIAGCYYDFDAEDE